jgi:hypothetical protein
MTPEQPPNNLTMQDNYYLLLEKKNKIESEITTWTRSLQDVSYEETIDDEMIRDFFQEKNTIVQKLESLKKDLQEIERQIEIIGLAAEGEIILEDEE